MRTAVRSLLCGLLAAALLLGCAGNVLAIDSSFFNNLFVVLFGGLRLWRVIIKEFFEVHLTFCPFSSQPGYTNSRQSIGPLKNGTLVL